MAERSAVKAILVGDDLSDGARMALRRAALLAADGGRNLQIVHVIPDEIPPELRDLTVDAVRERLRQRAERDGGSRRGAGTRRARTVLAEGRPFVEVIRLARESGSDLVVLGARARRRWRDAVVGTTAERVIRNGDVPVLIVKRPPRGPYRTVVAAIEASDAAPRVVDLALALLPRAGGHVVLLHAFRVPFESEITGGGRGAIDRIRREYAAAREAACRRLLAGRRGTRAVTLELAVVHGDPEAEVPLRVARERADLLVVGTHARSGIAHALLGSTAERLIRDAPCDVAVTRPARFTFELP